MSYTEVISGLSLIVAITVALFTVWSRWDERRIKLKIFAGSVVTDQGEGFTISITNLSEKPVTIGSVPALHVRGNGKSVVLFKTSLMNAIVHGETRHSVWTGHEYDNLKTTVVENLQITPKLLKTMRLHVVTSTGYIKKIKPNRTFLDELKSLVNTNSD